jgi:hypothetical protein
VLWTGWVGITVKGIGPGGSNVDILPRLEREHRPLRMAGGPAAPRVVNQTVAAGWTSGGSDGGHVGEPA